MKNRLYQSLAITTIAVAALAVTAFCNHCHSFTELADYHDSGKYYQDISNSIRQATYYMQFRLRQNQRSHKPQKLAIVMDIDETALSNYRHLAATHFQANPLSMPTMESQGDAPAIPYTLALYNYAKDHKIAVFFITGRQRSIAKQTLANLSHAGFQHWDGVYFNPSKTQNSTSQYRTQHRMAIEKQGYDIIMNIGNRHATLSGGHADMSIKLPNPFYKSA